MELTIKPKCYQCKTEKQDTNNWFMAMKRAGDRIVILPMPAHISATEIELYDALCGQSCVVKYVSSNLEELHK